jgi:hypothetical protein
MIRFFKELYLTVFTVGFRFRSPQRFGVGLGATVDAGKGVAGVTVVGILIVTIIIAWIEILLGARFFLNAGKLVYGLSLIPIYFINNYILLTRGHGLKFEREYDTLSKSRRIRLEVSCAVLLLLTIVSFFYTVSVYQHFFHIISKN